MTATQAAVLEHTLDPHQRAALRQLAEGVQRLLGKRLERIVLYGSRARGDAEPESDIDVLVVMSDEPTPDDRASLSALAADVQIDNSAFLPLSLAVMSAVQLDELRRRERRYALDIEREGIPL